MADGGRGWQWSLGALLLVLSGVLIHVLTSEEEDATGGEIEAQAARTSASDSPAEMRGEGADEAGPEPAHTGETGPDQAPAFDPTAFAHELFDGGWGPPEAGLGPPAEEPVVAETAEPTPPPEPRSAPVTPQGALRRAVFWQDLLEARVAALRAAAESATERGDDAAAQRAERAIERLERTRPGLEHRIGELEAEAEAAPPE
jgi:hypothetical protein